MTFPPAPLPAGAARGLSFAGALCLGLALPGPTAAETIETPKVVLQRCLLMAADQLPKVPGLIIVRAPLPATFKTEYSIVTGTTYFMVGDLTIQAVGQEIQFDYQCRVLRGEPQTAYDGRRLSALSGSANLAIRE